MGGDGLTRDGGEAAEREAQCVGTIILSTSLNLAGRETRARDRVLFMSIKPELPSGGTRHLRRISP